MERYIAGSVLRATVLTLLTVLALLVFFDFIEEMEHVGRGDYRLISAFLVAVAAAPRYAFEVLPIAALLGSLLGLGGLAGHGELGAMRAAGMSLRQIVFAVIKAGMLLLAVLFFVGDVLMPSAERFAQQLKTERLGLQVSLSTDYGFWSRDGLGFVNVLRVAPGGRLEDVYLYEMSSIGEVQQVSHARSASYQQGEWVLEDVQQSQLSENHVITRVLDQVRRETLVDPAVLEIAVREPQMLPLWGLRHYIAYLRDSGLSTVAYEVAFWSKVFTPLSILTMLFLAVPVVLGSLRTVGIGQRIFVGALVGAGFHLLTRGFSYAALVYEVNPALATGLPLFLFAGAGLLLLSRLR